MIMFMLAKSIWVTHSMNPLSPEYLNLMANGRGQTKFRIKFSWVPARRNFRYPFVKWGDES